MKMNINIIGTGLKKNEVSFAAEFGEGRGIWCGSAPVTVGGAYRVELELPVLFMRWVDMVPASGSGAEISMEGDAVVLTGILENIEDDGTGYLRLGTDVIMFECLGEPMALGGFVTLRTREIRLYPVNL